ncbi:hypothetical protein APH_0798 [Anaplasma phagocytophilum str. HZ]|uniref:Uncharacterized protein n=1 Tax=Anaplasma phagocytophilum (strain HZ) TaxID=212042 RepID=Q2GJS6_ANAPZ|nr:hypothetical protein APH_0798 [Anaplasma phagocytophilum str. HZ]
MEFFYPQLGIHISFFPASERYCQDLLNGKVSSKILYSLS